MAEASLGVIQDDLPFEVETDTSDYAIAAILLQNGRPISYFSRTLNASEKRYPAVEKEATAIVEAIRKWSHFLRGKHFTLFTKVYWSNWSNYFDGIDMFCREMKVMFCEEHWNLIWMVNEERGDRK